MCYIFIKKFECSTISFYSSDDDNYDDGVDNNSVHVLESCTRTGVWDSCSVREPKELHNFFECIILKELNIKN